MKYLFCSVEETPRSQLNVALGRLRALCTMLDERAVAEAVVEATIHEIKLHLERTPIAGAQSLALVCERCGGALLALVCQRCGSGGSYVGTPTAVGQSLEPLPDSGDCPGCRLDSSGVCLDHEREHTS